MIKPFTLETRPVNMSDKDFYRVLAALQKANVPPPYKVIISPND